ncbi:hypothetical protein BD410DRAFT_21366 [Rickenella mellea]|uniref:Uncharacterized protein n=1 Tax=Rickenella mellea TaxID=50990 RepID=A0A4R5XEA4_9AGAM|nr:hypothetical protein BD410DRAFT_21366 [Rickenella mellea]
MYYNKPPPPLPSQPRTYVNYTNPAVASSPNDPHQAFFHPQNRSNTAPGALYSYHTPPVVPSPPPPPLPPLPPSLMPGGPARHANNAQDHLQFYQRTQSSPGPSYDLASKPRRPSVPTPPFIPQPDYFSSQPNAAAYRYPPALPPKIPVAMYPNAVIGASTPPPLPPLPPKLPQTRYNRPAPLPTSLSEQWHTDGMPGTRLPLADGMKQASSTAPNGPRDLSQQEEEEEEEDDEEFVRALQESLNVSKRHSQWEPYDPQKFESDENSFRPPQALSVSIPVTPPRPLENTNDANSSTRAQYTPTQSWLSLEDSADDEDLAAQRLQDEQLARQLAEEEEDELDDLNVSSSDHDNREIVREEDSGIRLPAYDDAVPSTQRTESPRHLPRAFADPPPVHSPEPVQGWGGSPQRIPVGNSGDAPLPTHRPGVVSEAPPLRPRSTNPQPESQVESWIPPPGQDEGPGEGLESPEESSSNAASSSTSSRNPVGAVVEDELLLGVCTHFLQSSMT